MFESSDSALKPSIFQQLRPEKTPSRVYVATFLLSQNQKVVYYWNSKKDATSAVSPSFIMLQVAVAINSLCPDSFGSSCSESRVSNTPAASLVRRKQPNPITKHLARLIVVGIPKEALNVPTLRAPGTGISTKMVYVCYPLHHHRKSHTLAQKFA